MRPPPRRPKGSFDHIPNIPRPIVRLPPHWVNLTELKKLVKCSTKQSRSHQLRSRYISADARLGGSRKIARIYLKASARPAGRNRQGKLRAARTRVLWAHQYSASPQVEFRRLGLMPYVGLSRVEAPPIRRFLPARGGPFGGILRRSRRTS